MDCDADTVTILKKSDGTATRVESRESITSRPSLLNLDVRIFTHPASDILRVKVSVVVRPGCPSPRIIF